MNSTFGFYFIFIFFKRRTNWDECLQNLIVCLIKNFFQSIQKKVCMVNNVARGFTSNYLFSSTMFFSSNDFVLTSIQYLATASVQERWLKSSSKTSQKPEVCEMRIQLRFTKFCKKKKKKGVLLYSCVLFQSLLLREFTTIGVASIYCDQIYNTDVNEYSTIAQSHRSSTYFLSRLPVKCGKKRIIKTIVFLKAVVIFCYE